MLCIPKSVRDQHRRHNKASLQRVRHCINRKGHCPDFMHYFTRGAEKEGLSKPMMEVQASVIILAGSQWKMGPTEGG